MVISRALRDAGMEVVYVGNQKPESIVKMAIQEAVDVIGLSSYSAGHLMLTSDVIYNLKEQQANDILLIVGGIIPQVDIPVLKEWGVAEVFPPGSPLDEIVSYIRENVRAGSFKHT